MQFNLNKLISPTLKIMEPNYLKICHQFNGRVVKRKLRLELFWVNTIEGPLKLIPENLNKDQVTYKYQIKVILQWNMPEWLHSEEIFLTLS